MTILLIINTIVLLALFTAWGKNSFLDLTIKLCLLALALVNGVFAYRALDAIGFFSTVG